MAAGVQFINANRVITIDNNTDILVVKSNFVTVEKGFTLLPYYEDEITGFQINPSDDRIVLNAGNISGTNSLTAPRMVNIYSSNLVERNVRTRSLAKSSKMGLSNATYGMRIWDTSVSPKKLIFDMGHPLFQPKSFEKLLWNQTCTLLGGEWVFPLLWYSPSYPASVELNRTSGNTFRVSSLLAPNGDGIPRSSPLTLFWIMSNMS